MQWWTKWRRNLRHRPQLARLRRILLIILWVWTFLIPGSTAVAAQSSTGSPLIATVYFVTPTPTNNNAQPIAGATSQWETEAFVYQAVYAPVTIQLTGPPGTQFPLDPGDYQILPGEGSPSSFVAPVVSAVYAASSGGTTDAVNLVTAPGPGAPSGQAIIPNQGFDLFISNVVNPPANTYPASDFTLGLNETTPTSPGVGLTFATPFISPLAVAPTSLQAAATNAWTVSFAVSNQVLSQNDTLTLTGPPGTIFTQNQSLYHLSTPSGSVPITNLFLSNSGPSNQITLVLGGNLGSSSATTPVTMAVYGVTNPPAGSYPATDFSLAWNSSTTTGLGATAYAAQGQVFGGLNWTPDSSLVAGAPATWTASVTSPVAVPAGSSWTFSAPWTFPSQASAYTVSVNNGGAITPSNVAASGSSVELSLPVAVTAGDTVAMTVSGVINPAAGAVPGSQWQVSAAGVTLSSTEGYTWVSAEPPVATSVTSYQADAPGVTWTMSFPAEAALSGGDTLTLYAEGAQFPADPGEYAISVEGGQSEPASAAAVLNTGPGGCSANCGVTLTLPNTATAAPLQTVAVQIRGVTNPSTATVAVAAATTGVPAGTPQAWPPAGVGAFGTVGASGTPSAPTVNLAPSGVHPLPAEPLKDGNGGTLSVAMQGLTNFACSDPFNQDLQNGANFSNYTCASALWNPTNPPGSGGTPLADAFPNGSNNPGVFVAQSPTVTMPIYDATGCPTLATELSGSYPDLTGCQLNVYAAAIEDVSSNGTVTPQLVQLPSQFNYTPPPQNAQGYQTAVGVDSLSFTLPNVATTLTIVEAVTYQYINVNNAACPTFTDPATGQCEDTLYAYAAPIEVVQVPSAIEQLDVLPFKILYQPPGDNSSAQYSVQQGQSTSTDYSFTQSTTNSTTSTFDTSLSVDLAFSYDGWGAEVKNNAEWDQSATNSSTNSSTSDQGVSYTSSSSQTWTTGSGSSSPTQAPWRSDQFILLVHPQFAIWDEAVCANGAAPVTGGGAPNCPQGAPQAANQSGAMLPYAMIGANQTLLTVSAGKLASCAQGTPLQVGAYTPTVELTPAECQNLLNLDPFAATNNQAANPNTVFPNLNAPTVTQAITTGGVQGTYTVDLSNSQINTSSLSSSTEYDASVDTAFVDTAAISSGLDGSYAGGLVSAKAQVGATFTMGTEHSMTQAVSVQTSSTSTTTWQQDAQATLGDTTSPMAVNVLLDPRWDTLMFQVPSLQISGIQPSTGNAGQTAVIQGQGFADGPLAVSFCPTDGGPCVPTGAPTPVAGSTNTEIQVTVPPTLNPGTYTVTVTSWGTTSTPTCGTSSCPPVTFTVTPPSSSTAPIITGVTPNAGPIGGGTVITITGENLQGTQAVWFGGSKPSVDPQLWNAEQSNPGQAASPYVAPAPAFEILNNNTILACTPAVPSGQAVTVAVVGPSGLWSSATTGTAFTYTGVGSQSCGPAELQATPVINGVTPDTGPTAGGTPVTITGQNFALQPTSAVTSGNAIATLLLPPTVDFCTPGSPAVCVSALGEQLVNSTTVQAVAPAGNTGTVDVVVNQNNTASVTTPADQFTYAGASSCTVGSAACTPASLGLTAYPEAVMAMPNQQDATTLAATVLTSNGQPVAGATVTFTATNGSLSATSAPTNATGVALVTWSTDTPGATTISAEVAGSPPLQEETSITADPVPVVTGINPTGGSYAGGTTVTVSGTGFTGATTVYFGQQAVAAQPGPNGTLQAITPPGTGPVGIAVGNAAGIGPALANAFTYTGGSPLQLTTTSLPSAAVGQAYAATLTATGGEAPYTWQLAPGSSLPAGLSLNATTGVLSGTPSTVGPATFTAMVVDKTGATASVTLGLLVTGSGIQLSAITSAGSTTSASSSTTATVYGSHQTPTITATASGGTGSVTVSQYTGNPVGTSPSGTASGYYDLSTSAGNSFTAVQAAFCGLPNGSSLQYWTGSSWAAVTPQQYDASTGCITVTFSATSTPPIAALTGTPFAAVQTSGGSGSANPGAAGGSGMGGISGPPSAETETVNPGAGATLTATSATGVTVTAALPTNAVTGPVTAGLNATPNLPNGVTLSTTPVALLALTATPNGSEATLSVFAAPVALTVTIPGMRPLSDAVAVWNPLRAVWQPVAGVQVTGTTLEWSVREPGLFAVVPAGALPTVTRVAGTDRIGTAIAAAEAAYPNGAPAVILANAGAGTPSPDALAAAGLAGALKAPILLTPAEMLPSSVLAAIQALGARTVYVVGGPAAVSDPVVGTLKQAGLTVVRSFEGQDRTQTAALIDAYLYQQHLSHASTLYVANGVSMVDALAASPVLAQASAPLWLVAPGQTQLPSTALAFVQQVGIRQVVILGGPAAVAPSIAQEVAAWPGVVVTRLGGADREATAIAIARRYFPQATGAVLAADGSEGSSFVDALTAGPLAALANLPVVLTGPTQLPASTTAYLDHLPAIEALWVVGGTAAVESSVVEGLKRLPGTSS
ncbi:MAG: cell wall-binding repeat-containing protein [Firmicutes bacterium]|nr:cell wall-binding repeat-containing protein [Alicyclobacillaceae bacterium]MCL6498109.1 cell wall-binding repeat-containing protein [Bacillota bacterium]